jgi:Zn-dependent protease with chaperone function
MTLETVQHDDAVYFDGRSNRKHRVTLQFAAGLDIVEDGMVVGTWPYDGIRRADGPQTLLRLKCVAALPLARLEIMDEATKALVASHCGALDVGRAGPGQTWRIVLWSLAAVCSILVVALYGIPFAADRLAPVVPAAVEKRIGEAVDRQVRVLLGGKTCSGAEGHKAFTALVNKLKRAGGIETPLDAEVMATVLPNAFALPGGKVYMLNGLLQKAQNPDEIAGVIAHELGHVQHRDNLRKIIQTGGTSFLIGLLFGDVLGASTMIFATQSLLDASYSREAERGADDFAIEVMHKLGRSPKPMGELLFRITGAEAGKTITILTSHPLTEDRLALMKKEDRPNTGPDILSANEWRALKGICRTP